MSLRQHQISFSAWNTSPWVTILFMRCHCSQRESCNNGNDCILKDLAFPWHLIWTGRQCSIMRFVGEVQAVHSLSGDQYVCIENYFFPKKLITHSVAMWIGAVCYAQIQSSDQSQMDMYLLFIGPVFCLAKRDSVCIAGHFPASIFHWRIWLEAYFIWCCCAIPPLLHFCWTSWRHPLWVLDPCWIHFCMYLTLGCTPF